MLFLYNLQRLLFFPEWPYCVLIWTPGAILTTLRRSAFAVKDNANSSFQLLPQASLFCTILLPFPYKDFHCNRAA